MPYLLPLTFLLVLSCSACETDLVTGNDVQPEETIIEVTDGPTTTEADELSRAALALVNDVRQAGCRCGSRTMPPVPALSLSPQLTAAAASHSADQARMGSMQHEGSDGSKVGARVTRSGYPWRAVAENVAWNYPTVTAVVEGWLSSPGHCRNIMSANYAHMGLAVNNRYWTQVFARQ